MNIFHLRIVAYLLIIMFVIAGCGYKADPFYSALLNSVDSQIWSEK